MISIILNEGWHNQDYIDRHVTGFDEIRPWFTDFDAKAALQLCELDFEQVIEVSRLLATRRSSRVEAKHAGHPLDQKPPDIRSMRMGLGACAARVALPA